MKITGRRGIKYIPVLIGTAIIGFALLKYPETASLGVQNGLSLCAQVVIPSLFPFMALAAFITKSGLCKVIGKFLQPVTKLLFHLPGTTAAAIIMAFIGGFPVGARMTAELLNRKEISAQHAQRMMLFCVNAGPAFVISAVGSAMFKSEKAGLILFASQILSSTIVGIISGFFARNEPLSAVQNTKKNKNADWINAFVEGVADAATAMFSVCAWVILFACIISLVGLLNLGSTADTFLACVLEVTTGCSKAAGKVSLPVIALIIGWSGFSVMCQVLPYAVRTGVKLYKFVSARAVSGIISAAICWCLLKIFPIDIETFSNGVSAVPTFTSVSVPASLALVAMCIILILDIDKIKKIC